MQQALRVGKRVHAETGIDRAGAERRHRRAGRWPPGASAPLAGRPALVDRRRLDGRAGAGHPGPGRRAGPLHRHQPRPPTGPSGWPSRTAATRRAAAPSWPAALAGADLVVGATASTGPVLTATTVAAALAGATRPGPLVLLDLAVPRDVDAGVAELPGVALIDLDLAGGAAADGPAAADAAAVERDRRRRGRGASSPGCAAPTWRRPWPRCAARADEVVDAELRRLAQRCPDLDATTPRAEVARTVHRVVQRLLHAADRPGPAAGRASPAATAYAALLRELFDLDPRRPTVRPSTLAERRHRRAERRCRPSDATGRAR